MLLNSHTVTEDFIYCKSPVENLVALLKNHDIAPMAPIIKEGDRNGYYCGAWIRRIDDREGNNIGKIVRIKYGIDTPDEEIKRIYSTIEEMINQDVNLTLRGADSQLDAPRQH